MTQAKTYNQLFIYTGGPSVYRIDGDNFSRSPPARCTAPALSQQSQTAVTRDDPTAICCSSRRSLLMSEGPLVASAEAPVSPPAVWQSMRASHPYNTDAESDSTWKIRVSAYYVNVPRLSGAYRNLC